MPGWIVAAMFALAATTAAGCGDDPVADSVATTTTGGDASAITTLPRRGSTPVAPAGTVELAVAPTEGHEPAGSKVTVEATVSGPRARNALVRAIASGTAQVEGTAPAFSFSATGDGSVTFAATAGATTSSKIAYIAADDTDLFWSTVSENAAARALLGARHARGVLSDEAYADAVSALERGGATESKVVTPPS